MDTERHSTVKAALVAAGLACCMDGAAFAQASEEDMRFMNEIVEASNGINEETAREAHGRCVDHSKKLAVRDNVEPLQRLYFETEIESCIFLATNNGSFSDASGDACSHHYTYASKLSQVITQGIERRVFASEFLQNLGSRMENAIDWGPQMGCKGDYASFKPAAEQAKTVAALPTPEPDFALWQQIINAMGVITPETARASQQICEGFAANIAEKPDRPAAERAFLEGQIENCIARAMELGKYSDVTGDVCLHHYNYASKLSVAVSLAPNDPLYAAAMGPIISDELKMVVEQAPEMGCKQDYKSLLPK